MSRPPVPSISLRPLTRWRTGERPVSLDHPVVVAIINVTPDSFSDGGAHFGVDAALRRVDDVLGEGADMVDLGGESTRPGASRISVDEERLRLVPVLREVRRRHPTVPISIDTTRSAIARVTLDEGADAINDVSGLRLEPGLGEVVASVGAGLVLMHSRGDVPEMASYDLATYGPDAVQEVVDELSSSVSRALDAGVSRESIVIDPGVGFAKRSEHSLAVLRALDRLTALGYPVMVGASRKRVIGELTHETDPASRRDGTVGAHVAALALGARLFRVHDVKAHRDALDVAWALVQGPDSTEA